MTQFEALVSLGGAKALAGIMDDGLGQAIAESYIETVKGLANGLVFPNLVHSIKTFVIGMDEAAQQWMEGEALNEQQIV